MSPGGGTRPGGSGGRGGAGRRSCDQPAGPAADALPTPHPFEVVLVAGGIGANHDPAFAFPARLGRARDLPCAGPAAAERLRRTLRHQLFLKSFLMRPPGGSGSPTWSPSSARASSWSGFSSRTLLNMETERLLIPLFLYIRPSIRRASTFWASSCTTARSTSSARFTHLGFLRYARARRTRARCLDFP